MKNELERATDSNLFESKISAPETEKLKKSGKHSEKNKLRHISPNKLQYLKIYCGKSIP